MAAGQRTGGQAVSATSTPACWVRGCLEGLGLPAHPALHAHTLCALWSEWPARRCGYSGPSVGALAWMWVLRPECGCTGPPLGAPLEAALPSALTDRVCSFPRISWGVLLSYTGPLGSRPRPPSWG